MSVEHAKHIVRLRHKDVWCWSDCDTWFYVYSDKSKAHELGHGASERESWQSAALRILSDPEFWLDDEMVVSATYQGAEASYNNGGMGNSYWKVTNSGGELVRRYSGALSGNGPIWKLARQAYDVQAFEQQYRPKDENPAHDGSEHRYAENFSDFKGWSQPAPLPVEVSRDAGVEGGKSDGAKLIAAERERQISVEGWTFEHDDKHDGGQIVCAAVTYALENTFNGPAAAGKWFNQFWCWEDSWFKPSPDPIRNLVKAGALIAAEIDRLQRLAAKGSRYAAPESRKDQ
jgi:hypothetical protein